MPRTLPCTGNLDGSKTHEWVLEGVVGSYEHVTRTEELIKSGYLSKCRIKILLCKHAPRYVDSYHDEMAYLVEHKGRNYLIKNGVKDIEGNCLVLVN